uniref:Eukaryotic translation initiation factor 3 subunit E n=1 Tax=Oryza barthii TaxID=65489 RepID=A0A0D3GRC7_9ORYZ
MAEHDLTARMAAHMNCHLVFQLLEFLQWRPDRAYAVEEILQAKLRLLIQGINMVDYAMDTHKLLHGDTDDDVVDPVPDDMVERRHEVVSRLGALAAAAAPIVSALKNHQLGPDKEHNIRLLHERFQIGPDQIEALYQYAKFQFDCGNYPDAAENLHRYRALCTSSERSLSAQWGKLSAEILNNNWDVALVELNRLKEMIDSKDRYLNAIQTDAPHLLRYLAVAVVVNRRRRNMVKELVKVIQQEQHSYKDPITEFLECLYVNHDFDGAQQKLIECEQVILNDPFLGKRIEEGNSITVPLRDEFLENARLLIFESYCRIHRCIDIGMLSEKLNMSYSEAELWIMNLVSNSKLDAKIDSASGTLIMAANHANIHEQFIESLKNLDMRTFMLAKSTMEPA